VPPIDYPLFRAAGSPRTLGRAHGAAGGERIRAYLDYLAGSLSLSREAMRTRAMRFLPLFERHAPHLVEEIGGLAEGAAIEFADALAVQLRGELGTLPDGACTTFVIGPRGTAAGNILIGQTSDTPAEIGDFAYVLHMQPEGRPEFLMWTFGGMLGYHGVNASGVAHFANSLGGGPAWKFALSHYPLKRMLLECRGMDEALRLFETVPVCSNGNYVLCADGVFVDIEVTSDGPIVLRDTGAGFLAHSNHFLCGAHACRENFDRSLPDSFPRLERINRLIAERFGALTVADLKRILSDHAGHPVGICRHPHTGHGDAILPSSGKTVAALIAEPAFGRLHVARGNPCENPFTTYTLRASSPEA
jgi:isopenicillin-N N-acyltransferase like protein